MPDWANMVLPDTWPDKLNLTTARDLLHFVRCIFSKRRRVEVPDTLIGRDKIPKYVLQEFHNLPNGNYSNSLTRGYIKGFDHSMLSTVEPARQFIAQQLSGCASALDIGTAGGKTAAAIKGKGVSDVWGIDPSPYLLKHAAQDHPDIKFVQAIAEKTGFANDRFDAVGACFVFHEMPPRYIETAITEIHRIIKPGGTLVFAEPAAVQMLETSVFRLVKKAGLQGLYFRYLAGFVFEPFVAGWHQRDLKTWLDANGFDLIEDINECPIRKVVARKRNN
ncbi:Ubiquinone/menaquinone biosynthesis C-methyltransferase UbiE [BD1-7 clade bacterium]|uniref:Ubiquinone/menaquinone biosynthesis C-methyltransferase UbiE n=1 Tax=BD1-7 clade bacterium TaxID=2029982 RepID=A0A5S9PAJ7_9GAMM|nr:Ubiquinone/menaquinone biosynthesis C-methyltransferase UbiE [BD1-7 clade bacterium]